MFDEGVLKEDQYGQIVAVQDPEETQMIKSQSAQATKAKNQSKADLEVLNQNLDDLSDI